MALIDSVFGEDDDNRSRKLIDSVFGDEEIDTEASDYFKAPVAGGLKASGYGVRGIGQFTHDLGEKLRTTVNDTFGTDFEPEEDMLRGAGDYLTGQGNKVEQSYSPGAKAAIAGFNPTGNVFEPEGEFSFGENVTPQGVGLRMLDTFGQIAPIAATALVTRGGGMVGQMGKSAGVAAAMGGGAASVEEGDRIRQMVNDPVKLSSVPAYRALREEGVDHENAVEDVARIAESGAFWHTAPVSALTGVLMGGALSNAGQRALSKIVGTGTVARILGGAAIAAPLEGAQEVAELSAQQYGASQATGEPREIGEGSFGEGLMGAMGGAGTAALGGALPVRGGMVKRNEPMDLLQPETTFPDLPGEEQGASQAPDSRFVFEDEQALPEEQPVNPAMEDAFRQARKRQEPPGALQQQNAFAASPRNNAQQAEHVMPDGSVMSGTMPEGERIPASEEQSAPQENQDFLRPQNAQPEYAGPDRRTDAAKRKKISEMSQDEMRAALLTSDVTGLPSRRAYEDALKRPVQVSVDADALKWINDNMGPSAGDDLLRSIGKAMQDETPDSFHFSGDEFLAQADTEEEASALMQKVNERLKKAVIIVQKPDGTKYIKQGLEVTHGTGPDKESADYNLKRIKQEREDAGLRPKRGNQPPGVVIELPQGKQDRQREVAAEEVTPQVSGIDPVISDALTKYGQSKDKFHGYLRGRMGKTKFAQRAQEIEQAWAGSKQADLPRVDTVTPPPEMARAATPSRDEFIGQYKGKIARIKGSPGLYVDTQSGLQPINVKHQKGGKLTAPIDEALGGVYDFMNPKQDFYAKLQSDLKGVKEAANVKPAVQDANNPEDYKGHKIYMPSMSDDFMVRDVKSDGKNFGETRLGPFATKEAARTAIDENVKPVEQKGKAPWQMTQEEYVERTAPSVDSIAAAGIIPAQTKGRSARKDFLKNSYSGTHKRIILSALKEGETVPAEVLADYPDLVEQKGKAPTVKESLTDQGERVTAEQEIAETREPVEVAQPTAMKRVTFKSVARYGNGPKKVTGKLYELPGYKGPQMAVVEYKSPRGQGYRIYLPKSGVLVEDSNGVGTLNDTLKAAVGRVDYAKFKLSDPKRQKIAPPPAAPQEQATQVKSLTPELSLKLRNLARITENAKQGIRKFDPKPGPNGEFVHETRARATTRHANLARATELWQQRRKEFSKELRAAANNGYEIPKEYLDLAGSGFEYDESGKYDPIKPSKQEEVKNEKALQADGRKDAVQDAQEKEVSPQTDAITKMAESVTKLIDAKVAEAVENLSAPKEKVATEKKPTKAEFELQQLGATSGEWSTVQKYNTQSEADAALPKGVGWRIKKGGDTDRDELPKALPKADKLADAPKSEIDTHRDFMVKLQDGKASVDELKSKFERVVTNRAAITEELSSKTKDELLSMLGGMMSFRMKNEKKAEIIRSVYDGMLRDFHISGDSLSYVIGGGDMHASMVTQIRKSVEKTTPEQIEKYAAKIAKQRDERKAYHASVIGSIKDPKTLEDFERFVAIKGRAGLDPEQLAKFEQLSAEKTRGERASRKSARQDSALRAPGEAVGTSEIIKTKHTKLGHDLWQFELDKRVSPEEFKTMAEQARSLGGNYSSYRGNGAIPGWQFRSEESAKAFKALVAGDATAAKDVMQARRDAFSDDRSQTAVERLTEMADKLDEGADASLGQSRKENTQRRAGQAANAVATANYQKAISATMRNLAAAITEGKAKFLDRVRQKVQVEMLDRFVRQAQLAELRSKYSEYSVQERHKGEAPTRETIAHAKFPQYTAYRSDLAALGRQMQSHEGLKLIGNRILSVADDVSNEYAKFAKENLFKVSAFRNEVGIRPAFPTRVRAEASIDASGYNGKAISLQIKGGKNGEHTIILSPSEAMKRGIWAGDGDKRITLADELGSDIVEKAGRRKLSVPHYFETVHEQRKRLDGMGIETPAEFRSALREFVALREAPKVPDKIKEMERAMIGRKNDGLDFFPTPANVADRMVEAAGIEEGMSVLEPSAGMGHIAERIREAGVDPDVIELASDRRSLLEAKGFNLVGADFMETTGSYDRIIMNPPFSDRRDIAHVQHAYVLLAPGGRLVAIMGEGSFFGSDKKAVAFREWLEQHNGTDEKLDEGSFKDSSLPVTTGVNARMVVIDRPADAKFSKGEKSTGLTPAEATTQLSNLIGSRSAQALIESGRIVLVEDETGMPKGADKFSKTDQTETPEFKVWFGDSKVVDESGKPLVVYHGAPDARFMDADATFMSLKDRYGEKRGVGAFWFAKDRLTANSYADDRRAFDYQGAKPAVIAAYLKLENPLIVDAAGKEWREAQAIGKTTDVIEKAQAEGHDGVIIRRVRDNYNNGPRTKPTDTYVVFDSRQIKSATDNTGAFDPTNPDIRYSKNEQTLGATTRDGKMYLNLAALDKGSFAGVALHEGLHATLKSTIGEADYTRLEKRMDNLRRLSGISLDRFPLRSSVGERMTESINGNADNSGDILVVKAFIDHLLDAKEIVLGARVSGDMKTGVNQLGPESSGVIAERLSNLIKRHPAIEKNLSSLQIETQRVVLSLVGRVIHDEKILNSVVGLIPIDMMNVLKSGKFSTKIGAHNMPMLVVLPTGNMSNSISAQIDMAGVLAGLAAKISSRPIAWISEKRSAASKADTSGGFKTTSFGRHISVPQWLNDAFKRVPEDTSMEDVIQEVMAYAVERYTNSPRSLPESIAKFVRDFIAAIRVGLMRALPQGSKLRAKLLDSATEADLARLAIVGLRRAAKGVEASVGDGVMASKTIKDPLDTLISRDEFKKFIASAPEDNALVESISDIVYENDEIVDFGIRVMPMGYEAKNGDAIRNSYEWVDGEKTDNDLGGVSAISIPGDANLHGIRKALRTISENNYFGRQLILIKGQHIGGGQDAGEGVYSDATVVKIIDPTNPDVRYSKSKTEEKGDITDAVTEEGKKKLRKGYVHYVDKVIDSIDHWTSPMSALPQAAKMENLRNLAQGDAAKWDETAATIHKIFNKASQEDQKAIYDYLTTKGAVLEKISAPMRQEAVRVKAAITHVGKMLVEKGVIPEESRQKYEDAYLPQVYFAYLLGDNAILHTGTGKKISEQGYAKARKYVDKTTDREIRDVFLGEIKDPGYLAARAIAIPMRDLALINWLEQISTNPEWTLPDQMVEWKNPLADKDTKPKKVTPFWLKSQATSLRKRAASYQEDAHKKAAYKLADSMDEQANKVLEGIGADKDAVPDGYKQMPDSPRYGALRGLIVRKAIYDDIAGISDTIPQDAPWVERFLGYGGTGTKITQVWKWPLALDTPLPTPTGWTTMGDVKVGDQLFDERGQICEVQEVKEVLHGRECFEVAFSDGTKIVADKDHLWFVINSVRDEKILTTEQIKDTLTTGPRGDKRHSVPVAEALILPDVDLPVAPYALGMWLGDGDSGSARVCAGDQDADEIILNLERAGVRCSQGTTRQDGLRIFSIQKASTNCLRDHDKSKARPNGRGCKVCEQERKRNELSPITNPDIPAQMRDLGLLSNKHIPPVYLRASKEQRMELLRGLMDTDGWAEKNRCVFGTSIPKLRDDVVELLRSLGYKPVVIEHDPINTSTGKQGKTAWKIQYAAYADMPVFHLKRKRDRLAQAPKTRQRSRTRQIVSVTPAPSVPVRCIGVSSSSELFLAGVGFIPTHNSKVAANPPGQVRNFISNMIMLNLSGMRPDRIVKYFTKAVGEVHGKGKYYKMSRKHGMNVSTFAASEFLNIEKQLVELERQSKEGFGMHSFKYMGAMLMDKTGKMYQWSESVAKLMKMMHEMEVNKLTEEQAVHEANKWTFDYTEVNPTIRYLRNAPIGVPFVTYATKVLPRLLEVATKHPLRLLPYAAVIMGVPMAIASMYGVDDDDFDKLKTALPEWLEKRGNAIPMPYKDEQGRWQFVDIGYFLPWSQYWGLAKSVGRGEPGDFMSQTGALAGPFPSVIAAITTGKDPFTDREIINEFDPAEKKFVALMQYTYGLMMPPWLVGVPVAGVQPTFKGFAGHAYDALTNHVDKYGDPTSTAGQAALRLFGVNTYAIDPSRTRAERVKRMMFEISQVKSRMKKMATDRNLDAEDRKAVIEQYREEIAARQKKLQEYAKESTINPKLMQ